MNYFTIKHSTDKKIIGHYPQTEINKGYNPNAANGCFNMHGSIFPDFTPTVELRLHDKANVTDLIHPSASLSFGLVINEKVKSVLEKFNLPPHRFYPTKVFHKNEQLNYYWFHYIVDMFEYIDKEKSSIQIYNKFDFEVEKILPFPLSKDQAEDLEKTLTFEQKLMFNEIFFNERFPEYDIIRFREIQYTLSLVGEELLNALLNSGVTGFDYNLFSKIASTQKM